METTKTNDGRPRRLRRRSRPNSPSDKNPVSASRLGRHVLALVTIVCWVPIPVAAFSSSGLPTSTSSRRTVLGAEPSSSFSLNEETGSSSSRGRIMRVTMEPIELGTARSKVVACLQESNYAAARDFLSHLLNDSPRPGEEEDEALEDALQAFYARAFARPYSDKQASARVGMGCELIRRRLVAGEKIPRSTAFAALRAFAGLRKETVVPPPFPTNADAAFRMLQRLVTGIGIREGTAAPLQEQDFNLVLNAYATAGRLDMAHRVVALQERTERAPPLSPFAYSILLKGYRRLGEQFQRAAHRKQHRGGPFSTKSFVALGKDRALDIQLANRKDARHLIPNLLEHAQANGILPDIVMLHSLMDAYIHWGKLEKAEEILEFLENPHLHFGSTSGEPSVGFVADYPLVRSVWSSGTEATAPVPNERTYNIYLKGLAQQGRLQEALDLAHSTMEPLNLWDHITTNTLVQAAVQANDFEAVEDLLEEHTLPSSNTSAKQRKKHPNLEAYTTAIDGYAKQQNAVGSAITGRDGLPKALALLQKMKDRGVEPNEFTYTCIIGGLARAKKIPQAQKMMDYMKSVGIPVKVVTYNAMISGLVAGTPVVAAKPALEDNTDYSFDGYVDESVRLVRKMIKEGVKPNSVTASVMVDAFAKCEPPRLDAAIAMIDQLESQGIIPHNHVKVSTALIQAHGVAGDLPGAMSRFRELIAAPSRGASGGGRPDRAAINALLDACVKCDQDSVAWKTFHHYFSSGSEVLLEAFGDDRSSAWKRAPTSLGKGDTVGEDPDVISCSIIMTSLLKKIPNKLRKAVEVTNLAPAGRTKPKMIVHSAVARKFYEEMKFQRRILPDKALVDIILKTMIEHVRNGNLELTPSDVRFLAGVLRDAENLDWSEVQLQRRKRAVQALMTGRVAGSWEEESGLYGLNKKNRRRISSYDRDADSDDAILSNQYEDELFQKHGWNKVDSGFQLWGGNNAGKSAVSSSNRVQLDSERDVYRSSRKIEENDDFLESKGWNNVDSGFRIL